MKLNRTWKRHSCREERERGGEKKQRGKSVEASQMKKGGNAEANTRTHNSRHRAERVNLSLTPLASCTRTLFFFFFVTQITTSASQILFCSLSPIIFPWKACHWCDSPSTSTALHSNDNFTASLHCWEMLQCLNRSRNGKDPFPLSLISLFSLNSAVGFFSKVYMRFSVRPF